MMRIATLLIFRTWDLTQTWLKIKLNNIAKICNKSKFHDENDEQKSTDMWIKGQKVIV